MQVRLRTGGRLRHYLPDGSSGSQGTLEMPEGASVLDAMRAIGLPLEDSYLVTLNGDLVPADDRSATALTGGDDLGIFPPLKSG